MGLFGGSKAKPSDKTLIEACKAVDLQQARSAIADGATATVKVGGLTPLLALASAPAAVGAADAPVITSVQMPGDAMPAIAVPTTLSPSAEIAALLLENGADVNEKAKEGQTPLWYATWRGNLELASCLIKNGALVEPKAKGVTPLHVAAYRGHAALTRLLVQNGAAVDMAVSDNGWFQGWTPLHFTATRDFPEVAVALLGGSASTESEAVDAILATPLFHAAVCANTEVARVLLSHGAKVDGRPRGDVFTPLQAARYMAAKEAMESKGRAGVKKLQIPMEGSKYAPILTLLRDNASGNAGVDVEGLKGEEMAYGDSQHIGFNPRFLQIGVFPTLYKLMANLAPA